MIIILTLVWFLVGVAVASHTLYNTYDMTGYLKVMDLFYAVALVVCGVGGLLLLLGAWIDETRGRFRWRHVRVYEEKEKRTQQHADYREAMW